MKFKNNIIALLGVLSLFTACSDDHTAPVYTVGEADNTIMLKVGMNEGSASLVSTRGVDENHTPMANGGGHKAFSTTGTKLALRIDGTWTGHAPSNISQTTLVTLSAETNKHNPINAMDPVLYWDDYGTADPANTAGRASGLTIMGIGVDGYPTTIPGNWENVAWNVGTPAGSPAIIDQNVTNYWTAKDLVTSNNIRSGADGTYKFDDYWYDKTNTPTRSSNILEFTHAMTKITVQLTADEGFPRTDATAHFESAPTVILEGFNYTGNVNVVSKTSNPTPETTTNINMHLADGGASHVATYDALVFPGNTFADETQILTLSADGNTYKVTAKKLNEAIQAAITNSATTKYPGNDNTLLQAWNYKLLITVKKTDLDIKATILDWKTVETAEETPKVNVNEVYGHPTQDGHPAFQKEFDLYRSTSINGSFLGTDDHSVVSYADSKYTMSPQLYWPNHNTHYFFRGVWPKVDSKDNGANPIGPTSSQVSTNAIDINNVTYKKDYYPSDLMIGRPLNTDDKTPDETCKVAGHSSAPGICATEGNVHINFRYVMSQVEVHLETATGSPTPANAVNLTNAKVEIINGYTTGKVSLGEFNSDGSFKITDLNAKTDFTLEHVDGEDANYRHSAIVPQDLTFTTAGATSNLRFKITIYKDGDSSKGIDDIYYADVEPILKSDKSGKVAPNGKWESGVRYIYNLHIEKTAITVTATLKDWVTVTASDNIWF